MSDLSAKANKFIGGKIRDRRNALGFKLGQIAKALGISYQQIQKYETGANRISAGRLLEIAHHLDVPITYFYDGFDNKAILEPLSHGGSNRAFIELSKNFSRITDPEIRHMISHMAKALADKEQAQPLIQLREAS